MSNKEEIIADNIDKLNSFRNSSPSSGYLAGFIDGDGTIFIRKFKDGYNSGISISQSRTNILSIMKNHFGGKIYEDKRDRGQGRTNYIYRVMGKEATKLIDYLNNEFVIKRTQYNCLKEFNSLVKKQKKQEEKEQLCQLCLKTNKEKPHLIVENLSIDWIAGLFDAEGCITVKIERTEIRVKITQKNNPNVLTAIYDKFGYGKVKGLLWEIYDKNNILDFFTKVYPFLIVKRNQVDKAREYIDTYTGRKKITPEIIERRRIIQEFLSNEKHISE